MVIDQWMHLSLTTRIWVSTGFIGQIIFFMRFLVQWIVSERRGEVVIPNAFWFLSLGGSAILLTYAIHIKDPVFIIGQACGFFIYIRNLMLIRRHHNKTMES